MMSSDPPCIWMAGATLEIIHRLRQFREATGTELCDIPPGRGLGSSGALVAAVYGRVHREADADLNRRKELLAQIEGLLHGTSSGLDPLVCHEDHAVHLRSGRPNMVDKTCILSYALADSAAPRSTAVQAAAFAERMKVPAYARLIRERYLPLTARSIAAWSAGDSEHLWSCLIELSAFQLRYLDFAIPEPLRDLWRQGLASEEKLYKSCGAGGGGYMLRFERGP